MEIGEPHRKQCHRYNFQGHAHELTFSCLRRQAFLSRDRTRGYLADAIPAARQKHAFDPWAYVFMPEHVHLLVWPRAETYSISDILRSMQPVSRRAILYLQGPRLAGWCEPRSCCREDLASCLRLWGRSRGGNGRVHVTGVVAPDRMVYFSSVAGSRLAASTSLK